MLRTVLCLCVVLLAPGCKSKQLSPEAFARQGEQELERAISLLQAGRIEDSARTFEALQSEARVFEEPAGAEPTTLSWEPSTPLAKDWRDRYRQAIEDAWPVMREALASETIEVAYLKGILSMYLGQEAVQRVNEEYESLRGVLAERRANQYGFDCKGDPRACALLFSAARERLGEHKLTRGGTGNRRDYLGVLSAWAEVKKMAAYRRSNQTMDSLPQEIAVRLEGGPGTSFAATVTVIPPSRVAPSELLTVRAQHFERLGTAIQERLAGWP